MERRKASERLPPQTGRATTTSPCALQPLSGSFECALEGCECVTSWRKERDTEEGGRALRRGEEESASLVRGRCYEGELQTAGASAAMCARRKSARRRACSAASAARLGSSLSKLPRLVSTHAGVDAPGRAPSIHHGAPRTQASSGSPRRRRRRRRASSPLAASRPHAGSFERQRRPPGAAGHAEPPLVQAHPLDAQLHRPRRHRPLRPPPRTLARLDPPSSLWRSARPLRPARSRTRAPSLARLLHQQRLGQVPARASCSRTRRRPLLGPRPAPRKGHGRRRHERRAVPLAASTRRRRAGSRRPRAGRAPRRPPALAVAAAPARPRAGAHGRRRPRPEWHLRPDPRLEPEQHGRRASPSPPPRPSRCGEYSSLTSLFPPRRHLFLEHQHTTRMRTTTPCTSRATSSSSPRPSTPRATRRPTRLSRRRGLSSPTRCDTRSTT